LQLGYIPDIQPKDIYDAYYIGLDMADEILIEKIKTRIQKRLDAGMIEESIQLLKCKKLTHERMQKLGLEYAFISDYLQDKLAMDEFKEKLFFAIWHYVKRQRTWFRKNTSISWFTPECRSEIYAEVDLFLNEPFAH
jgi:tRNA dimethylallyltransferase